MHAALDGAGFLERSVAPALPIAASPSSETTLAGRTLGAYTLISHIGRGGMGSVWLARRSDGRSWEISTAPRACWPSSRRG